MNRLSGELIVCIGLFGDAKLCAALESVQKRWTSQPCWQRLWSNLYDRDLKPAAALLDKQENKEESTKRRYKRHTELVRANFHTWWHVDRNVGMSPLSEGNKLSSNNMFLLGAVVATVRQCRHKGQSGFSHATLDPSFCEVIEGVLRICGDCSIHEKQGFYLVLGRLLPMSGWDRYRSTRGMRFQPNLSAHLHLLGLPFTCPWYRACNGQVWTLFATSCPPDFSKQKQVK